MSRQLFLQPCMVTVCIQTSIATFIFFDVLLDRARVCERDRERESTRASCVCVCVCLCVCFIMLYIITFGKCFLFPYILNY